MPYFFTIILIIIVVFLYSKLKGKDTYYEGQGKYPENFIEITPKQFGMRKKRNSNYSKKGKVQPRLIWDSRRKGTYYRWYGPIGTKSS